MPVVDVVTQPSHGADQSHAMVVSIVSHGHGLTVLSLLEQISQQCASSVARVVVTLNVPEPVFLPVARHWPFQLDIVSNTTPLGFSENHNRALADATEPLVCVLNPDVVLLPGSDPFAELALTVQTPGTGCAYPVQLDANGCVQDSERETPTPLALWRRRALKRRETRVDWVNGACLVLPLQVWREMGGFDSAYFMYCEDVDLCLRVRLLGYRLQRSSARIEHQGMRASGHQWRHLAWHITSLLRLWCSGVFWQACFGSLRRAP